MTAAIALPAAAQQTRQARILVLYGTTSGNPVHRAAAAALRSITGPFGSRVALYEEFIDQSWFIAPHSRSPEDAQNGLAAYARYLELKYSGTSFDLIFAVGSPAYEFYEKTGRSLFPGRPVIACLMPSARAERLPIDSLVTIVSDSASFTGAIDLAKRLQPEIEHIAIVAGASAFDQRYVPLLPEIRRAVGTGVSLILLDGLPLMQLERAAAMLPPHTAVAFISVTADSTGAYYDSPEIEARLASVANAPVYDWNDMAFGRGIVGGQMLRVDSSVTAAARLAVRVINGEPIARLPRRAMNASSVLLDWRALNRWGIDPNRVPAGARIEFRPSTTWTRHRGVILTTLLVILTQAAIITALAIQRRRRRHAEAANRILVRQLITAQEAERARIGRELHDDINQKLAALSIALSRLRQRLPNTAPGLAEHVADLQDRTTALATDVRQLSHQLHSGVLQHAGLTAALRALCADFRRQHSVEITLVPVGEIDSVSPDVALCLYRVAQETLRNATTHSNALNVGVTVAREDDAISMSIADDGRGFDIDAARHRVGIGLASLEERVRILGGQVAIRSRPGKGTEISLRIPFVPVPPSPSLEPHVAYASTPR